MNIAQINFTYDNRALLLKLSERGQFLSEGEEKNIKNIEKVDEEI